MEWVETAAGMWGRDVAEEGIGKEEEGMVLACRVERSMAGQAVAAAVAVAETEREGAETGSAEARLVEECRALWAPYQEKNNA